MTSFLHDDLPDDMPEWDMSTIDVDERCPHCDSPMWTSDSEDDLIAHCHCYWCGHDFDVRKAAKK